MVTALVAIATVSVILMVMIQESNLFTNLVASVILLMWTASLLHFNPKSVECRLVFVLMLKMVLILLKIFLAAIE